MKHLPSFLLACSALCVTTLTGAQGLSELTFGPAQVQEGKRIDGIAAIVGKDVITQREFSRLGKNRSALEALIIKKLLMQEAQKRNIGISDAALDIAYKQARRQGKKISRERLREELTIQKLRQKVANGLVNLSESEVNAAVEQQLQQVDDRLRLVDVLVRVPETADTKTLQAAERKTQQLIKQLQTQSPQSVAAQSKEVIYNDLGWVTLSKIPSSFSRVLLNAPLNQYLEPIVDRDGIHILKVTGRQSQKNAVSVKVPETQVSHILIKADDKAKAKATIESIYRQLQKGADFATLAKQYSQDPGSATKGGSLNWARPGQMVADFEVVMDQTPIGKFSEPFLSKYGYHILKVHKRRQNSSSERSALEQQVRRQLFQKHASEAWERWLSKLRDEAYIEIYQ